MTRIPPSYRLGRAAILAAVAVAAYLMWTFVVVDLLTATDAWIADVNDWADDLNPLG